MMDRTPTSIINHFGDLEDPRRAQGTRHRLLDIIVIAICAVICGADGWQDVETFGRAKQDWLGSFLELPHGIPSHDTFGRVFTRLDPEQLEACFRSWIAAVFAPSEGQVVAVDGKALRRSHDSSCGKAAIHMISAWATCDELVLGQLKVDDKSNEISALPALLRLLDLEDCIVTIDAMGCQTAIAETILGQRADYVLALKQNQGRLYGDVALAFEHGLAHDFRHTPHDYYETTNVGHGRREVRRCWVISEEEYLAYFGQEGHWPGLRSVAMLECECQRGQQLSQERRYFISSLPGEAQALSQAIRTHWHIENRLHWVLDIAFREDECRVRKGHADENLAVLRHIALNLLKQEKSSSRGIKGKRLKAAWDTDYLLKVLGV